MDKKNSMSIGIVWNWGKTRPVTFVLEFWARKVLIKSFRRLLGDLGDLDDDLIVSGF